MKRILSYAIMAVALAAFLAGCSDGARTEELQPDIMAGGATVTKAELIDALWNEEAEISEDVRCVIGSTFTIKSDNPFTIAMNTNPTDFNTADVVIVSAVNIKFEDAASDGRGGACPAEGMLTYAVQASEEAPIDIEAAEEIRARHSLMHMVSGAHTDYPGCTIRAHFDKAGVDVCDPSLIEDDEDEAPESDDSADDDLADDEDDDSADDDSSDDDSADDDSSEDDGIVTIAPGVFGILRAKAQRISDDGLACGTEEIRSVRVIVDEYNCQLEGYDPRPLDW